MNHAAPRFLILSVASLFLIVACQAHAESDNDFTSPVTTLEQFQQARALGDQADSFQDKTRYWRRALTWQSNDIEWLHLAWQFANSLKAEWHHTGGQGHGPRLDHPYYRESESVYREILDRFDHMDLYSKNGADAIEDDSLLVANAACNGLNDYPLFLTMMQDFHDRRVKEWLDEPAPVKPQTSALLLESRYKRWPYEQRVADWLERRSRACEGQVFSPIELLLIDGAVKRYAYRCREDNDDKDPVPGLADLATRYTAPAISSAIHKYVEVESPPFPRAPVAADKVVELTLLTSHTLDNRSVGASKLDFDTGAVVANPIQWSSRSQQSLWMKRGGIDIEVDHPWDDLMRLIAFDLELIAVPGASWNEGAASWEQFKASEIKKGVLSSAHRGGGQMECRILANTTLPATFAFRTREGGVGILQLTEMKERSEHVREYSARYRLDKPGELGP